jgi:cyanophycinase-like exopeptidase
MTPATDYPQRIGDIYIRIFKALGVSEVEVIDVSTVADAESAESIAIIYRATRNIFHWRRSCFIFRP